jgi:hypothetical protein
MKALKQWIGAASGTALWIIFISLFYNFLYLLVQMSWMSDVAVYICLIALTLLFAALLGRALAGSFSWKLLRLSLVQALFCAIFLDIRLLNISWLGQIVCALIIIFYGPVMVCTGLGIPKSPDVKSAFQFLKTSLIQAKSILFNGWCALLLLQFLLDTLCGGLYSMSAGIDAQTIAGTLLFQGNPMATFSIYFMAGQFWHSLLFLALGVAVSFLYAAWIHKTKGKLWN